MVYRAIVQVYPRKHSICIHIMDYHDTMNYQLHLLIEYTYHSLFLHAHSEFVPPKLISSL